MDTSRHDGGHDPLPAASADAALIDGHHVPVRWSGAPQRRVGRRGSDRWTHRPLSQPLAVGIAASADAALIDGHVSGGHGGAGGLVPRRPTRL